MSSKVYKSLPELVEILASRGLDVDVSRNDALDFLRGVNYYRFTGYALPFLKTREAFRTGSRFSDICAVYSFDRQLRLLMTEALGVIELTFRTNFCRELARMLGDEAYLRADAFRPDEYAQALRLVQGDYDQSVERCAQHFKRLGVRPPVWALVDVTTFGHLSKLFRALKNEYRLPIAKIYGYDSSKAVCSLLQHLCVLRNRCAHHSRVYDLPWGQNEGSRDEEEKLAQNRDRRRLYIFPELPEWTALKRRGHSVPRYYPLFYQLALIYRFLMVTPAVIYDAFDWRCRVAKLLEKVPNIAAEGVDLKSLLQISEDVRTSAIWNFAEPGGRNGAKPMSDAPNGIAGGSHEDGRGTLRFVNDFDMSAVRRFYTICNSTEAPKRGWIMHKRETKWFFPVTGVTEVKVRGDGEQWKHCSSFVLRASEPSVLQVPPGHWFLIDQSDNQAIEQSNDRPPAEVMVFSNCRVGEFPNDDFRKDEHEEA